MEAYLFKLGCAVLASAESNTLGVFSPFEKFYFSVGLSKMIHDKVFGHEWKEK